MDDLFGLKYERIIESLSRLEKQLSMPYIDAFVSQLGEYNRLANVLNENLFINQAVAEYSKQMAQIIEPLRKNQELWEQSILAMTSGLAEFQKRINEMYSFPKESIQEALSLTSSSLTDYSTIIESITRERVLEQWVERIGIGEENTEVSSEEITEAYDDLTDISNDTRNWQQKLTDVIKKWKDKNPVICFLLVSIVLPLILSVVATPIYNAITSNNARIKDEPSASGNTIYNLSVNQKVTIISTSSNYYYEVEFYDEESGELRKGWLSKRSVKHNESTSESKTEDTEESE